MIDITLTVPNGTSTSDSQMVGNTAISLIRLIAGLNEWIDMK